MIFYHVSTETQNLRSFFREGAKSTVPRINEKNKGFYVWTNEDDADVHVRLLNDGFLNKSLDNHEALILGIPVQSKDLIYPSWQIDVECAPGLLELLKKNESLINSKLNELDIELPDNDSFLKKVSGITCKTEENKTSFVFNGKTSINTDISHTLTCYDNSNPCNGYSDAIYLQTLVDALCTHSVDFQKEYQQLMQQISQYHGALKYTGSSNLPVSTIKHAQVDENGMIKKTIIFDAAKNTQQICPFFKLKNIHR